ncbi:unnamed protein product, partial [Effrenium voratum]
TPHQSAGSGSLPWLWGRRLAALHAVVLASAGCGRFEVEPAQLGFPERPQRDHHGLPGRRACGHRPRQCARHHGGADFAHGGAGEAALESHGHHGLAPLRGPPFPAL